ncbi:MAG TPA: HNH endonuclease signature motif containing protein, partial [Bacteriovoracaceae bacterium]|nr:HNH endonuclease signature motif containing protein [Bacteriovoracaceae bacterium]
EGAKNRSRYIPASVKREVYKRAQGKCENCGSYHALEFDHVIAWGMGGQTNTDSMKILCKSCNQIHAIIDYGINKMEKYFARQGSAGQIPLN